MYVHNCAKPKNYVYKNYANLRIMLEFTKKKGTYLSYCDTLILQAHIIL